MQFWNELEGRTVDNRYPLRRLLRSEGRTAWFETRTANGEDQTEILSLTESLTDADEVIARLKAAQALKHPSLLEIRQVGKAQLDETLVVYAVMEPADQTLSDVLRDRALSKEEARQIAEALVGALTAVHQQGIAHGRVEPSSVLAVGEAIKLRSDCLQSPGATRAGDIAGLGATLFQAFTQRQASSADDSQINRIPAPFAEIVRNSLSARWGLPQVAAALDLPGAQRPAVPAAGVPASSIPQPPAAVSAPTALAGTGSTPEESPAPQPRIVASAQTPESTQARQTPPVEEPTPVPTPSRRVALYIILAAIVAAILAWLIVRPKAPSSAPAKIVNPVPAPSPVPAAPSPLPESAPAAIQPAPSKPGNRASETSPVAARNIWRVVAYTYHHQDQAQHKADTINQAHPDLKAEVFNPGGDPNHFLVVLGGAMDSHEAAQMRSKAVSEGLAADTYVQNFRE